MNVGEEVWTFECRFETVFGQVLYVVGSHPLLGVWNPRAGLRMRWTEGHVWRAVAHFSSSQQQQQQQVLFKFCVLNDSQPGGGVPYAEPGPDRSLLLQFGGKGGEKQQQHRCVGTWGEGPKLQQISLPGFERVYGDSKAMLFRSPMAFAPMFDTQKTVLAEWKRAGVTVLVSLAGAEEMRARTGLDLVARIWSEGVAVLCHPIEDLSTPRDVEKFRGLVDTLHTLLLRGNRVVVACHAGIGRTGMLLACLAVWHLGVDPHAAIAAIRSQSHFAVQTSEQVAFVEHFSAQ